LIALAYPRSGALPITAVPDLIEIVEGDITALDVDAIVNAANSALAPGGGVCGAIHRAAGPKLAEACAKLGGCETGEAKITPGFNLKARYVIHAVGPVWGGGERGEDRLLAKCYRNSLQRLREQGLTSIAFPAISTGIYGFPAERAARIAVRTILDELKDLPANGRVVLCCFGAESRKIHEAALASVMSERA
jgi:O-acetyl-ADP-ribose deacetylase (regulator of RNase III)